MWQNNLNGNDTTMIMPFIHQMWSLILQPTTLNEKFWDHINSLTTERKTCLFELFSLNVETQAEGNVSKRYVT